MTKCVVAADGQNPATAKRDRTVWERAWLVAAASADAIAIALGVWLAYLLRFHGDGAVIVIGHTAVPYPAVGACVALAWWLAVTLGGTSDSRATGPLAYQLEWLTVRTLALFGLVAILAFAAKLGVARTFYAFALLIGFFNLVVERWAIHRVVSRARARGLLTKPVLAIGEAAAVERFAERLRHRPSAGYRIAGTMVSRPGSEVILELESPRIVAFARELGVAVVAYVSADHFDGQARRRIDWALREEGIGVVVVPPLDSMAGARLRTELVGGIPLIHALSGSLGTKQCGKAVFDRVTAAVAIAVWLLPSVLIAAVIAATSRGGVFYTQERIGMNGRRFRMLKFRTMRSGAHAERARLANRDEGSGVLFKVRDDPRVTPIGRILRRYSLDELPQFLNVLVGSMSVVGPRPPLPEEVSRYSDAEMRRLLVKPGITGLWQVGGRSDLTWEESVRLDLHYVDTWSVLGDASICLRTVRAMVNGEGAY